MTLQQKAVNLIEALTDEQAAQVIQFAGFLQSNIGKGKKRPEV